MNFMKIDPDLCKNLKYELNPRVRCAFGNVCIWYWNFKIEIELKHWI